MMSVLNLFKQRQNNQMKTKSKHNSLKLWCLKLQFSLKRRLDVYELIEMILKSGVSIEDSLRQIIYNYKVYARSLLDPNKFIIEILEDVYYRYTHLGITFAEAFSLYLPTEEFMILCFSKDSGKSLSDAREIGQKLKLLKQMILKSLIKPTMYISALIGMMLFANFILLPTIIDSVPPDMLPEFTVQFYYFNSYIARHLSILCLGLLSCIALYKYTAPRVTGIIRSEVLDKIIPFSTYKNLLAVKFMITLAAMLSNKQNSVVHTLKFIKSKANFYLSSHIDEMLKFLHAGCNSGDALAKSSLFSRQLSCVLAIYSNLGKFEFGIQQLANEYLNKQTASIKRMLSLVGTITMLLTAVYIVCFMWAIYAIGVHAM